MLHCVLRRLPHCAATYAPFPFVNFRAQVVHELKHGEYHFWCTQQPFVAPLMLRLATQQNAATGAVEGAEKSAFAW